MATKRKKQSKKRPPASAAVNRAKAIELLADGWGVQEVAKELRLSRGAIWAMRDDAFDAEVLELAQRRAGAIERQRLGVAALEVLGQLMRNKKVPAQVRQKAASDLADRAGLAAPKRLDVRLPKDLANLSDEEIDEEIQREAERARERKKGSSAA